MFVFNAAHLSFQLTEAFGLSIIMLLGVILISLKTRMLEETPVLGRIVIIIACIVTVGLFLEFQISRVSFEVIPALALMVCTMLSLLAQFIGRMNELKYFMLFLLFFPLLYITWRGWKMFHRFWIIRASERAIFFETYSGYFDWIPWAVGILTILVLGIFFAGAASKTDG
ncbi:MAG: hypothetical protein KKB70_06340 [Proteobacteria bacterium]|nr:hypothetical protein [Pseudomonadota bacterium]